MQILVKMLEVQRGTDPIFQDKKLHSKQIFERTPESSISTEKMCETKLTLRPFIGAF